MNEQQRLSGDRIWPRTVASTARALATGALQPIAASLHFIEEAGITFMVHLPDATGGSAALGRKGDRSNPNPFLPYDPQMFVADLSPTHVCLLNKFNVIDNHLLIVTRAFEEQESALTAADFAALWQCMAEVDGLAFYNAGERAGASQRHKHLQLAPYPWIPGVPGIPVESALALDALGEQPSVRTWPYVHAAVRLEPPREDRWQLAQLQAAGELLFSRYRSLLHALGISTPDAGGLLPPYNLLATRSWMLVAPRVRGESGGIQVNALGFAGSFLARTLVELQYLRAEGPLAILHRVSGRVG